MEHGQQEDEVESLNMQYTPQDAYDMLGLVVQSSDPPGPGERRQEDSKIKILPCALSQVVVSWLGYSSLYNGISTKINKHIQP